MRRVQEVPNITLLILVLEEIMPDGEAVIPWTPKCRSID